MKSIGLLLVTAFWALTLSGCSQPTSDARQTDDAAAGGVPGGSASVEPSGAIAPADLDLAFAVVSGPTYDPAADAVMYQIQVTNNGNATLASHGEFPVNVGVVIRGADGTLDTPPANLDFVRIALPQPLARGQQVTLPISFDAAPTLGGTVVVDAVQERVSWFSGYGKPVLTLGTYMRCNGKQNTLCLADGSAVAAAQ